jgi:hypothetical protein
VILIGAVLRVLSSLIRPSAAARRAFPIHRTAKQRTTQVEVTIGTNGLGGDPVITEVIVAHTGHAMPTA